MVFVHIVVVQFVYFSRLNSGFFVQFDGTEWAELVVQYAQNE